MKIHDITNGLRIDLDDNDIETLADINWLEIGNVDAEYLVSSIVSKCEAYTRKVDNNGRKEN